MAGFLKIEPKSLLQKNKLVKCWSFCDTHKMRETPKSLNYHLVFERKSKNTVKSCSHTVRMFRIGQFATKNLRDKRPMIKVQRLNVSGEIKYLIDTVIFLRYSLLPLNTLKDGVYRSLQQLNNFNCICKVFKQKK